ncbi:MAG: hypothetical protein ACXWCX_23430 [Burkholderiales bacterium]
MSLKIRVLQVLNGPAVARIRFRFPIRGSHVTITSQTFHHVARAIVSGRVTVEPPTDLAPNVAAQYDVERRRADGSLVRANTLEVKSVAGRVNETYVVHESLHAAYDLLRTGIDANAEEASAYVCSALYCRMTGRFRAEWGSDPIWGAAGRVAQTLLRQYQKGHPGIPMVGEHEWRMLRAGVGLHLRRPALRHFHRMGPRPAIYP